MKLVKVTWTDACSRRTEGRWSAVEDVRELTPFKATSCGWVIADHPDYLIIASHIAGADDAGGDICIPRGMITAITDLKENGDD